MTSLYDRLGGDFLAAIITEFYDRAFKDPLIAHLFWGFDQKHLTEMQIQFASSMLGGPGPYRGKSLGQAHRQLKINQAHFGRRQVLMAEVLDEFQVDPDIKKQWLEREDRLKPLIVKGTPCNQ
ncbi:truncated hemoglobin [Pseudobacteriovorax antillogorgiicola]|uniref:Truncated hemoglobin YjbI n=1 Tax=Pseudobacteriovorax antillogorgiicola TaxID=1513793 RepID=A0A1Y6CB68_9BACT|nr:group 1 truncated hemoglobin [Pseudobacteriovorax antillogorgiicola]TCS48674.1 truncated hemoglobin YjbI [Pseudobacteriovorax antillogorgiicola]SMF54965.1 Truncated hemoglobin YjbI [Pseudobacteriovorax antillogorgiicola]